MGRPEFQTMASGVVWNAARSSGAATPRNRVDTVVTESHPFKSTGD